MDNTSTRMELDVFGVSSGKNVHYKEDENFYKIYKRNFVVKNAIDTIAKRFSNSNFFDLDKDNSALLDKIKEPNSFQSREEFLKDFSINILASGYSMIWKKYKSFGMFDSLELIVIPTDTDITSFGKKTITTTIEGNEETIKIEDVIIFYDTQRQPDTLRGISRLLPLKSQIDNINDAQRAKNIQIHNSGTTIVSPKAAQQGNNMDEGLDKPIMNIPIVSPVPGQNAGSKTKTQKEEMEDRLNFRGMENRIIVSSKGVDAKNLSAELNSMNFSEKIEADILAIYAAYGVPVELTPYGKNATFDNKEVAENSLIESEVQPLNNSLTESLNGEFEGSGNIYGNYDHLSSVSKTKNEIHKTRQDIANTYRELFKDGVIDREEARKQLELNGML